MFFTILHLCLTILQHKHLMHVWHALNTLKRFPLPPKYRYKPCQRRTECKSEISLNTIKLYSNCLLFKQNMVKYEKLCIYMVEIFPIRCKLLSNQSIFIAKWPRPYLGFHNIFCTSLLYKELVWPTSRNNGFSWYDYALEWDVLPRVLNNTNLV